MNKKEMQKEEKSLKKRLVKNSFWNFISLSINRIGALIFTIILARFLMPERYGIYSLVLSTTMIFCTFADLGINRALTKYISSSLVKNRKKIPVYYRYLLKMKLILSLGVSILLLILAYPLSFYIFKNSALFLPFLVAAFYVFILSLDGFYTQIFYSIEKNQYVSFKESITQILRVLSALIVFYFITASYHIIGIFFSLILIHLFILFLTLFYLKKLIPDLHRKSDVKINKRKTQNFIGFLTIASISTIFFSYVDSLMLGLFLSPEYVGYYRAAFSLVFGISALIAFPNAILLPIYSKINKFETEKVLNKTLHITIILAIPASFGFLVFGKYIIRFFYGFSYLSSVLPLYFLAFLIMPMVCIGNFVLFFSAKEKPQIFAKLIIITSILNILLNLILIKSLLIISPLWATAGAGIATVVSWHFYFLISFYISKKRFNLNISLKSIIKPLIASLIMVGILFYLLSFIKEMTIILGIFLMLLALLIYFILMILIKGIIKEDLDMFKILIRR